MPKASSSRHLRKRPTSNSEEHVRDVGQRTRKRQKLLENDIGNRVLAICLERIDGAELRSGTSAYVGSHIITRQSTLQNASRQNRRCVVKAGRLKNGCGSANSLNIEQSKDKKLDSNAVVVLYDCDCANKLNENKRVRIYKSETYKVRGSNTIKEQVRRNLQIKSKKKKRRFLYSSRKCKIRKKKTENNCERKVNSNKKTLKIDKSNVVKISDNSENTEAAGMAKKKKKRRKRKSLRLIELSQRHIKRRNRTKQVPIEAPSEDSLSGAIRQVPDEIWIKIMGYLNTRDKVKCRSVCRKLFHVVADPILWRHLDLSDIAYNLQRSYKAVRLLCSPDTRAFTLRGYFSEEEYRKSERYPTLSNALNKLVKARTSGETCETCGGERRRSGGPGLHSLTLINCNVRFSSSEMLPPVRCLTLDSCHQNISLMSCFSQPKLQEMLEELNIVSNSSDNCCPISLLVYIIKYQRPERADAVSFPRVHTLRHACNRVVDPFTKPGYLTHLGVLLAKMPGLERLCLVCCTDCDGRDTLPDWLREQNAFNKGRVAMCDGCRLCTTNRITKDQVKSL